jgi:PAS domain S-box-containing protein
VSPPLVSPPLVSPPLVSAPPAPAPSASVSPPPEGPKPGVAPSFPAEPYALPPDIKIKYVEPPVSLADQAAVVSFDEKGTIVSANEACTVMFGWEGATLVGEGLAALLRPGTDQDVMQFIQERLHGGSKDGRQSLNVIARRRDGVEFPASVTTLIWSSETRLMKKSDPSISCLTAIFRAQPTGPNPQLPTGVHGEKTIGMFQGATNIGAPAAAYGSAAVSQQAYEEICRQFSAISSEAATLRESLAQRERETGDVVARLASYEQELKQIQSALETERGERTRTEERSRDLAARLADVQKRSSGQNSGNEESSKNAGQLAQELGETKAALATVDEALNQNVAHCGQLEAERLEMRREIEALTAKLAALQQQGAEPAKRTDELEERLRGVLDNLDKMSAEPEKRSEAHVELETELGAAKAAAEHAEACLREEVERSQSFERRLDVLCSNLRQEQSDRGKRFEEELARHREEREFLNQQLAAQQAKADESQRHAEELEQSLVGNQGDLERVRAELERQIDEQQRSELEWRQKLEMANAQASRLSEALQQAEQRAKELQQQLNALQQDRTELNTRFGAEQQAAAEVKFRVTDLEERLRQNAAELEQVKTDRANAAAQQSSDMAMANLYHMRDLLGSKLEIEQRVAAESDKRSQAVEEELRKNSAELERVKDELSKQSDEQLILERKLELQLAAAKTAAEQADATLKAKQAECGRLQTDMAELQQARDDLRNRLGAVQQTADKARQTSEEFEQQLGERTAELERARAEQLRQVEEQKKIESEFQSQLVAAKSATERAVAACEEEAQRNRAFEERLRILGNTLRQEELERTKRMEGELTTLRQACEKLTQNHAAEQQATAAARRQGEELEQQLRAKSAALDGLKGDQARQAQELTRLTSELQAMKAAKEQAEAAQKEKAAECARLQTALNQTGADLSTKLSTEQQASAASRQHIEQLEQQLRDKMEEHKRLTAAQTKQAQEKSRLQSELQTARAALERAEAAQKEKAAAWERLEAELEQARAHIAARETAEKQAATTNRQRSEQLEKQLREKTEEHKRFASAQAKQAQEHTRLESELQAAKAAVQKLEPALNEKTKQVERLERDTANLRNEVHAAQTQFAAQQQALAKAKRQGKDFDKQKQTQDGEIAKLQAALDEHTKTRQRSDGELQEKLKKANETTGRLEGELSALRAQQGTLKTELSTARKDAAEARQQHESLEVRLREATEGLKRAQDGSRPSEQVESENQRLTEASATLTAELCHVRDGRSALEAQLIESQRQIQEGVSRLTRATADFEKERGERRRAENRVDSLTEQLQELHGQIKAHLDSGMANQNRMVDLEQRLRQNEDQLGRVHDDLQKERTDRQLVEQQLRAADALSSQLRNCLTSFDLAKEGFKRAQVQLESRLQASHAALKESESKLQHEMAERIRKEEALAAAQRAVQEHSHDNSTELTKLKAELEEARVERKLIEGGMAQSRYASLESARSGLAMVSRLRSQIREPVDGLMQLTRRLLETELEDEPKKLVDSLLENALLVQRTLQEAATLSACAAMEDSAKADDTNNPRAGDGAGKPKGELQP